MLFLVNVGSSLEKELSEEIPMGQTMTEKPAVIWQLACKYD